MTAPLAKAITEQLTDHLVHPRRNRVPAWRRRLSGPYWLRRPFLIIRDLLASRDRPNLKRLGRIEDPETFVWSILPHAARTFSACIALLPARSALPAAVAYLYCRMLDTYEDLMPDRIAREASLAAFAARFDGGGGSTTGTLAAAPAIGVATDLDDRDRAHLLLVQRAHLVDRVFLSFDLTTRGVVRDLVRDMAEGMRWSSATFAANGGVLTGENELTQYCRHVLGNPVVFSVRLLRLHYGNHADLTPSEREDAMRVGEMVQLANITRDVEKDLRRGIAYDGMLKSDLGRDPRTEGDAPLSQRCRIVRERLSGLALQRAPSYARVVESIHLPPMSVARASAVLMLLFTERYFRNSARRLGNPVWDGPSAAPVMLTRAIAATFSRPAAQREFARVERAFLQASQS
ncbi:MAG: squalene/phytoene synthase family protein [Gemmatimonadaceae bacterium]